MRTITIEVDGIYEDEVFEELEGDISNVLPSTVPPETVVRVLVNDIEVERIDPEDD